MVDFFYTPVIPEWCSDCKGGTVRKPYPDNFYPCSRCEGTGRILHLTLTYPGPLGPIYAGVIERPYRGEDCYVCYNTCGVRYAWSDEAIC